MDILKKKRSVLRTAFTRGHTRLLEDLQNNEDLINLKTELGQLDVKLHELTKLDSEIFDNLLREGLDEDTLLKEIETADEYVKKFKTISMEIENKASGKSDSVSSVTTPEKSNKRKFKLPKIEFRKFGGEVKDWLPFWGQFKKIHEDPDIDKDDKYQYLLQATVPNSKAREIVESYPPCGSSYEEAIEYLKSRFTKEDVLVEHYIRELLKLTLALNAKTQNVTLASMYDKIESHLRALETLNVTKDKYAALLFPLVESCLSEELLRAWQRSRYSDIDKNLQSVAENKLESLMKFLKSEVENEDRITVAAQGFDLGKGNFAKSANLSSSKRDGSKSHTSAPTATAADLVNTQRGSVNSCVFCDGHHPSEDCFKARKMSSSEKETLLQKKRCCFLCLKRGHLSKYCKTVLKCILCNGKHVPLMCPKNNVPVQKGVSKESRIKEEHSLSNVNCEQVYLQTLTVKMKNGAGDKMRVVRILFDTGSQRSYIKRSTAEEMEYQVCGEEELVHNLFGGHKTSPQIHSCYKVRLQSMDDAYACNFKVLNQNNICSYIPALKPGQWMKELKLKGINLYPDKEGPIEVLVGSDVYGKLLTGRRELLDCGLAAIETHLGWIFTGKFQEYSSKKTASSVSMFVQSDHHPVIKENSTKRIRPVFDASSKEKGNPSLNDCLEKGKNLIELIPNLLLRFRLGEIGVISDIQKAFLQISLDVEERDFLRFLWLNKDGSLKIFRHRRVVFGVSSSPFLLGAVIDYHLRYCLETCENSDKRYSVEVLKKLLTSFYVDNCVTSVDSIDELQLFIKEATQVFSEAKFNLRGWEYPDPELEKNTVTKVLGIKWDKKRDSLSVQALSNISINLDVVTQRTMFLDAITLLAPAKYDC